MSSNNAHKNISDEMKLIFLLVKYLSYPFRLTSAQQQELESILEKHGYGVCQDKEICP